VIKLHGPLPQPQRRDFDVHHPARSGCVSDTSHSSVWRLYTCVPNFNNGIHGLYSSNTVLPSKISFSSTSFQPFPPIFFIFQFVYTLRYLLYFVGSEYITSLGSVKVKGDLLIRFVSVTTLHFRSAFGLSPWFAYDRIYGVRSLALES
jgi:hypothetical protein